MEGYGMEDGGGRVNGWAGRREFWRGNGRGAQRGWE